MRGSESMRGLDNEDNLAPFPDFQSIFLRICTPAHNEEMFTEKNKIKIDELGQYKWNEFVQRPHHIIFHFCSRESSVNKRGDRVCQPKSRQDQ